MKAVPKILIIEDNPLNLELATDLLEANGFTVSSAQTAEDGLRMARELLPELVLMDFMSLGERLNWDQLAAFVAQVPDAATLRSIIAKLEDPVTDLTVEQGLRIVLTGGILRA